jgi:aminopeptidase YwaD
MIAPSKAAALLLTVLGALGAALPGAGRGAAPTPAQQAVPEPAVFLPPPAETLVADRVEVARLEQTVRDLVRIGPRMGGTPGGEKAAAFLAAAFAAAGIEPRQIDDPPHPAHWEEAWTVDLEGGGALASAYPYGFSPTTGPAAAPLVVLPGGLSAAMAAMAAGKAPPPDWQGKVLFVQGEVLGAYRQLAAAAGRPLAILTDAPGDGKRYLDAARVSELPAMPGGAARPIAVFGVSFADGRRLAAAAAGRTVRIELRSTVREGRPRTVLATLPGRDPERYYLICAHGDSDSGGPGADDNGSGEAVVVELARVLTALVREGRLPVPRVSLRFAVWGSEYASSEAYVAREGDRLRDCQGVINLDEVGTGAERDAIYFESNEVPWNRELLRAFDRVGRDYLGRPGYWPEYTTNPSQGGTDSYAFLPKRFQGVMTGDLQIPATTIYTAAWDRLGHVKQTPGWESPGTPDPVNLAIDYSRYYHSSADTPGNTTDRKPEAMVRAARAIGIALLRLTFL